MQNLNRTMYKAARYARRLYEQGFSFLAFLVMLIAFAISGESTEIRSLAALPEPENESESQWRASASEWLTGKATEIAQQLKDNGIPNATVYSRIKAEDSAREKAARRGVEITDLNDLYGMRIVVNNELAVYQCLNYICSNYAVVPGTMKNYIVSPKASGYQSVHVVAQIEENRVEFQLRTQEMHAQAEEEHEAYKERMRAAA